MIEKPSEEMVEFFMKRTKEHIDRVKSNMKVMEGFEGLKMEELVERGNIHDQSKYSFPENEPYIWLTWYHKCKNENKPFGYPEGKI